ncbi:MAG: hypothetical protein ABI624_16655 [Casimicrobiaceae bacterium]
MSKRTRTSMPPLPDALRLHRQQGGAAATLRCTALYEQLLSDALASLEHPLRKVDADTAAKRGPKSALRRLSVLQHWFLSNCDRGPFSFHRCCLMLSLDPDAVRDRLRARGLLDEPAVVIERRTVTHATPARMRRAA